MKQVVNIIPRLTDRSTDQLDIFLSDINKFSLLTAEEELALCKKIQKGDEQALEELCNKNLRFVVSVAKQYQDYGVPLADLINEGSIGLKKAARRFDHTRGFRFLSHAVRWILQAIKYAIAEQSRIVKLPHNQVGAINKLKKYTSKLEQQLGRLPTQEELALALDCKTDDVHDLQILSNTSLTLLDNYTDDSDTHTLIDNFSLGDENTTEISIQQEAHAYTAHQLLNTLNPDEQTILKMKYGISPYTHEYTDSEIAEKFDIRITTVGNIIEQATLQMKRRTPNKRVQEAITSAAEAQRATIVQLKYGFAPYARKYTEEEIAQKLNISLDHITHILGNAPHHMIQQAKDANILSDLILSLNEEQKIAVCMKYGIYHYTTPCTDIEIAHHMQVTVLHVKSLIRNFDALLRKAVFASKPPYHLSS